MNLRNARSVRAGVTLVIALVVLTGTPGFLADADLIPGGDTGKAATSTAAASRHHNDEQRTVPAAARAAAKAAPPAALEETSDTYAVSGIIDQDAMNNSDAPGVLVPLAQAESSVSHWMEAVDAAGPTTPLSDPSFEGTVFIPNNEAFEAAYPQLGNISAVGRSAAEMFADMHSSELAAQLNSLTVPGVALTLAELNPGKLLRTSDGDVLKVLGARADNGAIKLQHSPSGTTFTVLEPDLQSGNVIGHVVDKMLPPAAALAAAVKKASPGGPCGRYASAMSILVDPALQLSQFSQLIERAGLMSVLVDPGTQLTLFAPNNKAVEAFLAQLPPFTLGTFEGNVTLVDQLVSAHLVAGVAMGTKALEALPAGQLRSQSGAVMSVQNTPSFARAAPVSLIGYGQQAGHASPEALLTVDGALVTIPNLIGGRAVVHIIDKVLVPIEVAEQLDIPATALELSAAQAAGRISNGASSTASCSTAVQLAGLAIAAVALGMLLS